MGVDTPFIEPGSPWENGYAESFNSRMRDELLDGELFLHIDEMKYVVERRRMDYNHYRPTSSRRYVTPAGFAELCRQAGYLRPQTPVLNGVQDSGIPHRSFSPTILGTVTIVKGTCDFGCYLLS